MDGSLKVLLRLPRNNSSLRSSTEPGLESLGRTSQDDDVSDDQEAGHGIKRKATYTARKEELAELAGEVVTLHDQLKQLKAEQLRYIPITTEEKTHAAALRWHVMQSRMAIVSAESLASNYTVRYRKPLIGDYIHLPRDAVERQQILDSLKAHKMQEALAFLAARCQHVDLRRFAREFDCFEASNGDLISQQWAVAQIKEGQPTVRRVFDELLEFARTSEMAIAEKAGIVGVRENDSWLETIDATQFRTVASYAPNLLVEKNSAVYTQYYPRSELFDQPHGVLVSDYVDQDDAYPYNPHERIRTDVSSVIMVVECPKTDPGESRAVVIVNWAFKRIHRSTLATDRQLQSIAREFPRSEFSASAISICVVQQQSPMDAMSDSLKFLLRVPLEDSHRTDGNVMQSPGHTSHDGGDASDDQDDGLRNSNAKKRKSTYVTRKEEMVVLAEEAVALREQLQELKAQQLRFQPITTEEKNQTAKLRWQVTQSRLSIANAQSLMSSYNVHYSKPLIGDYIHLPHDPVQRQQILEGLKPHKMREALAFLAARCQHLDLRRRIRQIDSFEAENGDLICNHWAVAKIKEGQPSVRRVYDEMVEFARTSEMAIAERSGIVGVRESDNWLETVDATQVRMLISYPSNHFVEKNNAIYSQYFAQSEALDQPHGVFLSDYVDQDDAYPYNPHERIRVDISTVIMVVECPKTHEDEPRAVVIMSWTFKRIHHSQLATEDDLLSIGREGTRSYYDVMVRMIREKLACQA